jgi:RNA polymerase sigma-70 factor, ECF subfamily
MSASRIRPATAAESKVRLVQADADVVEQHRAYLLRVAYRLTGSLADAEVTTVVSQLCLDRLRSAAVQRERANYLGPWLPEPLVTQLGGPADPLDEVVRDDGCRWPRWSCCSRLTPEQRVALVLHDALSVPFTEIANVLGCSVPAARQQASRARRPVRGADKVARFILGLLERYGPEQLGAARLVLVNGDLGMVIPPWPGDAEHPTLAARVSCFAIRDGQIAAIYDMVNPDKIGHTFGL